jgi:GWxTD domain-containing protein
MKKILLLVFISTSIIAQVEYSRTQSSNQYLPKFYIDLASYESRDSGKTKVDIFIKVPYSNIQFLKIDNGYLAKYSFIISLYDEDDELKLEKLWNEKIETQSFKQTNSSKSYNVSYKSLDIESGKYKLVCKLEDNESKRYATYEQLINIRLFEDPLELSDVVIVSEFVQTDQGLRVIPSISNLVTSNDSSLSFFYEVYSDFEQAVKIQYTINDVNSKPLYVHTSDEKVKKGKTEINKILNGISFGLGDYQLEVRIVDEENNIIKGSGKKFSAQISGVPTSIKDLDLAIQQMQYIASPSELDEIEEIKDYDEKLDNYLEYWNKKDPSPNSVENETMNEYYRRVEYANEHFKGYFKGWKSDMGMIYITLGPPDQVTRRPYEMDTRPYEIWDYFVINRSFVFIDQTNFGDYRLQNPVFGEWFRYRP